MLTSFIIKGTYLNMYTTINVQQKYIVTHTAQTKILCNKYMKFMSQQGHDNK